MNAVLDKEKRKRPSKGVRTHIRRIKQEGRRDNISEAEIKKRIRKS